MKSNQTKVYSTIVAVVISLLAGCASFPSADMLAEVQDDLFSEAKTYNGGE